MRVAVIPARGGSKRVPGKNVRLFAGRPMLSWPISAALESDVFDHVIVSTDDPNIAATARELGASTPFVRPAELSDDFATTSDVVRHALACTENAIGPVDSLCCLYATAPFVTAADLRGALRELESSDASFVFSVTSFAFPIQRALRMDASGAVSMFDPRFERTRSQDLEPAYHDAGQFYWGRARAWAEATPIFAPTSKAWVLPRHRVQDIDTEEDWVRAELMFSALRAHSPAGTT